MQSDHLGKNLHVLYCNLVKIRCLWDLFISYAVTSNNILYWVTSGVIFLINQSAMRLSNHEVLKIKPHAVV